MRDRGNEDLPFHKRKKERNVLKDKGSAGDREGAEIVMRGRNWKKKKEKCEIFFQEKKSKLCGRGKA